ncbi:hypothetical protein ACN47E_005972 [Coniothyrium glycines]
MFPWNNFPACTEIPNYGYGSRNLDQQEDTTGRSAPRHTGNSYRAFPIHQGANGRHPHVAYYDHDYDDEDAMVGRFSRMDMDNRSSRRGLPQTSYAFHPRSGRGGGSGPGRFTTFPDLRYSDRENQHRNEELDGTHFQSRGIRLGGYSHADVYGGFPLGSPLHHDARSGGGWRMGSGAMFADRTPQEREAARAAYDANIRQGPPAFGVEYAPLDRRHGDAPGTARARRFMDDHTQFLTERTAARLQNQECPICLESAEEHQCVQITGISGCRHMFGAECLKKWLEANPESKKICPLCRADWLPEVGIWEDDPRSRSRGVMGSSLPVGGVGFLMPGHGRGGDRSFSSHGGYSARGSSYGNHDEYVNPVNMLPGAQPGHGGCYDGLGRRSRPSYSGDPFDDMLVSLNAITGRRRR